jgi:cobalamin-dependent methionine synthase I
MTVKIRSKVTFLAPLSYGLSDISFSLPSIVFHKIKALVLHLLIMIKLVKGKKTF